MGLTIHWSFQGPRSKAEARAIIEKMRQRALDLPFESVSDVVHFQGPDAQCDRDRQADEFRWLKNQAGRLLWDQDRNLGWQCPAKEIIGFEILVAPGSEPMEVFLAAYPKTMQVEDQRTGKSKRIRTNLSTWSGGAFCKTQYASHPKYGGVPNFLRAHLSVCRMLDYAKELGILAEVSDEGDFFTERDIPALVKTIGDWNEFIAAMVGAIDDQVGEKGAAPIKSYPDFEHLEAAGQDQIDGFLRKLKDMGKPE